MLFQYSEMFFKHFDQRIKGILMRQQNVNNDSPIRTVAEVNEQERGLERTD